MLDGKTAIVTGSTSGIGLGIAEALAAAGCRIVLNGFGKAGEIEIIRTRIAKSFGNVVRYDPADMTKPETIAAMIVDTEKEFGAVDILVNNAGIQHVAPVEDFPIDKWNEIIAINLSASFHSIRQVLPGMKRRRWGRIISIASAHALVASPFKAAYVAAKHGMVGLTKVIALEGDGSILMQVGSLATVAARRQKNLAIVIMDNGTYQITGGQLTATGHGADIVAMARGAGIAQSVWAADETAFEELVELSLREDGPWLIGCRIDQEKPADTTERDPPRIRDQFMRGLGQT